MDIVERATIDEEVIEVQTARAAKYDDIEATIARYLKSVGTIHQVNFQTDTGPIATKGKGIIAAAEKTLLELIEALKTEQAGI